MDLADVPPVFGCDFVVYDPSMVQPGPESVPAPSVVRTGLRLFFLKGLMTPLFTWVEWMTLNKVMVMGQTPP